jgi:hypothetical protein
MCDIITAHPICILRCFELLKYHLTLQQFLHPRGSGGATPGPAGAHAPAEDAVPRLVPRLWKNRYINLYMYTPV